MRQQKHKSGEYKHDLRNYVYYSEQIKEDNIDIIIRYTLDNYVAVSGTIGDDYITRAGYLINLKDLKTYNGETIDPELKEIEYKDITIGVEKTSEYVGNNENIEPNDLSAVQYYKDAYAFTYWFLNTVKIGDTRDYLKIGENNDPEDENSSFVQHKRQIMKEKIEGTLNSSITAYANKTGNNYKMPKFTEEDWSKVYNNISVISFVQGMNIGFKNYNNYCILNSTNNQEYVNANLIYFTDVNSYHDIRCSEIADKKTTGYKIGSFEKQSYEYEEEIKTDDGNTTLETRTGYYYKHNELACYECINGTLSTNQSIYEYVRNDSTNPAVKISYFSALARERYKTIKLLNSYNAEYTQKYTVTYDPGEVEDATEIPEAQSENIGISIKISDKVPIDQTGNKTFSHWESSTGGIYYPSTDENQSTITGFSNITLTAIWNDNYKIRFYNNYSNTDNSYEQVTKIASVDYTVTKSITRSGYNFLGWNTERNGTGTTYNIGSIYKENQDLKLYAQWSRSTVFISYFNLNEELIKRYEVEVGENIKVEGSDILSESEPGNNYFFIGWSKYKREVNQNINKSQLIKDTIEVPDYDINIYPYYIELDEQPTLKYQREIGIFKEQEELTLTNVNGKSYTNKEKITYNMSNPNASFVTITKLGEYNADSGYFETEQGKVREANLGVNIKIVNINNEEIFNKTYRISFIVDRKNPTIGTLSRIDNITQVYGKFLGIEYLKSTQHNRETKVSASDNDSGVSSVQVKYSNVWYDMSQSNSLWVKSSGNSIGIPTSSDLTSELTIKVTDYAGNSIEKKFPAGNAKEIITRRNDW